MSELLWIVLLSGVAYLGWRGRKTGVTVVFGGLAVLLILAVARRVSDWLGCPVVVPVLVAAGAGIGWYRLDHSRASVGRIGRAARRKAGVASGVDIARIGSGWAMRRQASLVRPSLAELGLWQRLRLPVTEVAIPLCRAGMWRVWCSIEDVVLIFGTARHGKSGLLGNPILDAAGAVITTSTKPDLYHATKEHRAKKGPVDVYSPTAVGGIASTMSFNPVTGCEDPVTAAHRAEDMLPLGGGSSERAYWVGLSREVFAALLHAAALGGQDCPAIARWVAEPDEAREPVLCLLKRSPDPTGGYSTAVTQFFDTNPRTRSSIATGIRPALAWLINPHARAAASGGTQLDVARLLRERGTLYLLGDEQATTSALVAALAGHIAREAKKIAARMPGGRLDPGLLLALDEAAGICPVPLQRWTADFGSHGITIVACFQSRAQLIDKWGGAGAASILNNAGGIVLFGGTNDEADLCAWSTLFGVRDEPVVTTDASGQVTGRSVRSVPVFSTTTLATLPKARVVVKRRHMAPVIGRAPMYWRRSDIRQTTWSRKLTNTVASARANATLAGQLPRPARQLHAALAGSALWHLRTALLIGARVRRARGRR